MSAEIYSITGEDWGWILLVSVLSIVAFWAQLASLQWIEASTLGSIQALEVLFAYFMQIFVMHQSANMLALIGSGLVMLCVCAISLSDNVVNICQKYVMQLENSRAITKC